MDKLLQIVLTTTEKMKPKTSIRFVRLITKKNK